jgi:hypothetical protein
VPCFSENVEVRYEKERNSEGRQKYDKSPIFK